ncbi:hypothetical protein AXG89_33930 [Burkholderia sp. PAMC 26561]|nr:hypothetical protein AXG89_33930 [Burkholderia sp. PAMC 26561]
MNCTSKVDLHRQKADEKSRSALRFKGYNLKHFVTVTPGLFAHNHFNGLNTYVIECSVGKEQHHSLALIGRHSAEARFSGACLLGSLVDKTGIGPFPTFGLLALTP